MPCLPPGDLSDSGIEPESLMSPALTGKFFTTSATWEAPTASGPRSKNDHQNLSLQEFKEIMRTIQTSYRTWVIGQGHHR